MFHLRKGRSGPVSGTGSMSGFSLTWAWTTRTRKGSRTGPSIIFFGSAGEKRWKKRRTVITSHEWVHTVTDVCFCTVERTMHRRGLPASCWWWWWSTHSLLYPPQIRLHCRPRREVLSTPCRRHIKSQPVPRCAHGLLLRWGGLHWLPTKGRIQRPTSPRRPGRTIRRCSLRWERGRIHGLGIGSKRRSANLRHGPRWRTLLLLLLRERVGLWVPCIVL